MNSSLPRAFFLAAIVALIPLVPATAKDFKDSQVTHIENPAWFINSPFLDLQEDLAKAKADGKQGLMVVFNTEGCSYCDAFIKRSLSDPKIAASVQKQFDSIGLEIFDDAEMTGPRGESLAVKQFAQREGAGFSPTLLFYGDGGARMLRVVGYQSPERFTAILAYLAEQRYQHETLAAYFTRLREAGPEAEGYTELKGDTLFGKPPYALDRSRFPASKPLMVLFEQTGCTECGDFHAAVLALPEVRSTLEKFEVVRLDARDDTTAVLAPDGRRVTPAAWYQQQAFTRLPALMFFDPKGNAALKTDALVLRQRMMNSLNYMLERAYEKDWTYQRFARAKGIERSLKRQQQQKGSE